MTAQPRLTHRAHDLPVPRFCLLQRLLELLHFTGTIFIPFHYYEAAVNKLTIAALDPVAKIPEYKVCAVRLEELSQGTDDRTAAQDSKP